MLSCRLRIFAFVLLALCAPIACVSMEGIDNRRPGARSNSALNYYRNRVMDLRDIVTLSFTIGLQAGATPSRSVPLHWGLLLYRAVVAMEAWPVNTDGDTESLVTSTPPSLCRALALMSSPEQWTVVAICAVRIPT